MNELRGIVLEIKDSQAHILTDRGDFIVCDAAHVTAGVGEEVLIAEKMAEASSAIVPFKNKSWMPVSVRLAAAAIFLVAVFSGTWFYPADWLYLEINPSIAMKLNVYERVIGFEGLNSDGAQVASKVQVYGKPVEAALEDSFSVIKKEGYMAAEKSNAVIIGYSSDRLKKKAGDTVATIVKKEKLPTTVATIPVKAETITTAKEEAASPINLEIIKKNDKIVKSQWKKELQRMEKMKTLDIIKDNKKNKRVDVQAEPDLSSSGGTLPVIQSPAENPATKIAPDRVQGEDQSTPLIDKPQKDKTKKDQLEKIKPEKDTTIIKEKREKENKNKDQNKNKEQKLNPSSGQDQPLDPNEPLKPDPAEKQPVSSNLQQPPAPDNSPSVEGPKKEKGAGKNHIQQLENQLRVLEKNLIKIQEKNLPEAEQKLRITQLNEKIEKVKRQLDELREAPVPQP